MGHYVGGSGGVASALPATGFDNISTANLVHFYNFESDGLSGSTFRNGISGGTADVTLSGSNFIDTTIKRNGASAFKVTSTNFAYLTTGKNLFSSTQTIALKFYLSSTGITDYNVIFASYFNNISNYNGFFQVYRSGANWILRYVFYNPSIIELILSNNIPLNAWHSIAITKNGTTIQVFLNGSYVTQYTHATNNFMLFNNSATNTFAIGRDRNQSQYTFNGAVDDLRIYNRVLTGGEITTLHTTLT
jgi:hypothetical protein